MFILKQVNNFGGILEDAHMPRHNVSAFFICFQFPSKLSSRALALEINFFLYRA